MIKVQSWKCFPNGFMYCFKVSFTLDMIKKSDKHNNKNTIARFWIQLDIGNTLVIWLIFQFRKIFKILCHAYDKKKE